MAGLTAGSALAFALAFSPVASGALKPDLTVTTVSADAAAEAGGSLTASATTRNAGKRTSKASATGLFLSLDSSLDPGDTQLVGDRPVPKLKPKKSHKDTGFQVGVPDGLPDGTYSVFACADVNLAVAEKKETNNCRAAATGVQIADVSAPGAPVLDPAPAASSDNTPDISGDVSESGVTVSLFTGGACAGAPLDSVVVGVSNHFSFMPTVSDNTSNTFSAKATDSAGNPSSCSNAVTYTEDSATAAPSNVSTSPASGSDNEAPHVLGNAESGATVTIYKSDSCAAGTSAGSGVTIAGAFDIAIAVADGSTTTLTAKAVDAAGNTSACSSQVSYQDLAATSETEPNDTAATADAYPGAGGIKGSIAPANDIDYFSFVVPTNGSKVVIETFNATHTDCSFDTEDTVIRLFDTDGTTSLVANDDKASGACSLIDGRTAPHAAASNLTAGTYYVAVAHPLSGPVPDYRLSITVIP